MPDAAAQDRGIALGQAPARGHLAPAHHVRGRQDPQLVGEPPARDQVELGLAVQAFLDLRQLALHAPVGKQAASPEVPACLLLEESIARCAQVRLVHGDQLALDLCLAREQPVALREEVVDAQVVAQEVRARGLAFDDDGLGRAHRGAAALGREHRAVRGGIDAFAPVVLGPAGCVHAKACHGAGHLVRHGPAAHREEPRGRELLEAKVLARLHGQRPREEGARLGFFPALASSSIHAW